ncbi:hypothetical protein G6514_009419 [Epicoccum nigrum]|nr:hypothetical protein G6514_009419 [Epicoccum nigrum]
MGAQQSKPVKKKRHSRSGGDGYTGGGGRSPYADDYYAAGRGHEEDCPAFADEYYLVGRGREMILCHDCADEYDADDYFADDYCPAGPGFQPAGPGFHPAGPGRGEYDRTPAYDYHPAGQGREDGAAWYRPGRGADGNGAQPPRRETPRPAGRKKGGRKGVTADQGRRAFVRRK